MTIVLPSMFVVDQLPGQMAVIQEFDHPVLA